MTTKKPMILLCSLVLSSGSLLAENRVDLQGTSIIGNRELPKVLYIVPWKGSELPQLGEVPMGNLIDEALSPLDRDEFRRQIDFFNTVSVQQ